MTEAKSHRLANQDVVESIDRLLRARSADATICPSEVARALVGEDGPWRAAMSQVRAVAAAMAQAGRLRVTRRGADVDAMSPGGPIRLGSSRRPPSRES